MDRRLKTNDEEINIGPVLKITKLDNNKIRIGHIKNTNSDKNSQKELNILALNIDKVEHGSRKQHARILSSNLNKGHT